MKEGPLVRVRDLPIAGRRTFLVWRKRRFRCRVCGCTFTERQEELPSRHHRRGHELATIVSDPDNRRVVEVLEGRSRRIVERYLRSLPAAERRAIRAVSIDPYDAYR